jgi:hypothetical protein
VSEQGLRKRCTALFLGIAGVLAGVAVPRIASGAVSVDAADDIDIRAIFLTRQGEPVESVDDPTARPPTPPVAGEIFKPSPGVPTPSAADAEKSIDIIASKLEADKMVLSLPSPTSAQVYDIPKGGRVVEMTFDLSSKPYSGHAVYIYALTTLDPQAPEPLAVAGIAEGVVELRVMINLSSSAILGFIGSGTSPFVADDPALMARVIKNNESLQGRD